MDGAAQVGHQWLILAWLPESDRASVDAYKGVADTLNRELAKPPDHAKALKATAEQHGIAALFVTRRAAGRLEDRMSRSFAALA